MSPDDPTPVSRGAKALGVLIALRTAPRAVRRAGTAPPPPPPESELDPASGPSRPTPAPRRWSPSCSCSPRCSASPSPSSTSFSRATRSCSASALGGALCLLAAACIVAGKFVVPQETYVEERDALLVEEQTDEVVEHDRGRGRGHLPPRAAHRRRRRGRSWPCHRRRHPARLARTDAELAPPDAVAARRAAGRRHRAGRTRPTTSRSARSTRRCPSTATPIPSAPACSSCACRPSSSTCRPPGAPGPRRGSSPTRRSARTPAARSRSTAIRPTRRRARCRPSPAPATTRRSSPGEGGRLVFGPAGRALPQLPLMIDADGHLRAAGPVPRGHRAVVVERAPGAGMNCSSATPIAASCAPVRAAEQRVGLAGGIKWRCATCSPTTGRSCSARSRSTRSSSSSGPGSSWPSTTSRATPRSSTTARTPCCGGEQMSEAYRSVLNLSVQRPGRPAVPPGPPLGGGRVHRRDRAAPAADLLHRRLPQAARPQLLHRADHADARDPRGLRRLLAGRRPPVGDGTGDRLRGGAVDPGHRRAARLPGLGRAVPRQQQRSGRAWRSSTCC